MSDSHERKSDPLLQSTIRSDSLPRRGKRMLVPCLTILVHPDHRRVGERASLRGLLIGQPAALSRSGPSFTAPGSGTAAALEVRHVSRSPVAIEPSPDGGVVLIAVDTPVQLDGAPIGARHHVSAAELERGVVLELGDRVALLLHLATMRPLTPLTGMLGQSDAIEDVRLELLRVADLDTPVLLRGETGTGKERAAQAIHAASRRAKRDYVAINMATIPEAVAVSTLFGHARGAFTGANDRHRGLFERASGGTLMLDEIGETPAAVQPMLLRAVETGRITPLGDEIERAVNLRFIAATDSDLERELRSRAFSAALLHRLAGYEIHLPPLRARREDIAILLMHFITEELSALGSSLTTLADGSGEPLIAASLISRIVRHPLPGNVRQLRNVARHLVISNRGTSTLALTPAVERQLRVDSDDQALSSFPSLAPSAAPLVTSVGALSPRAVDISDDQLREALRSNHWSPTRAAAALGIPNGTLHDMIRRTGAVRRAADIDDRDLKTAYDECHGNLRATALVLQVSERALRLTLRQRRWPSDGEE